MTDLKLPTILTIIAIGAFSAACGPDEATDSSAAPGQGTGQLPPNHPPLQGDNRLGGVTPPPSGSGTGAEGLAWSVPEGWIETEPSSPMRKAQYRIPGATGDAELVVFYFGPGQGGDTDANVNRWVDEFSQPSGQSSRELARIESSDSAGVQVKMVEVAGTYSGGGTTMGGGKPRPGYMLLGAIAQGPDANWFFKLTGPEGTVAAQRDSFREMILSLRAGG